MKALDYISILENRAEKLLHDIRYVRQILEDERKQRRLDRKEACHLLEYDKNYIYTMKPQPPFDSKGYITYGKLEEWVSIHKPARLTRLKKNFQQLTSTKP